MALMDATSTPTPWFSLTRHDDAPSEEPGAEESPTEAGSAGDDDEAARLLSDALDRTDDPETDEGLEDPEGADELGDRGKKALDAMKARLKADRERAQRELAKVRKDAAEKAARLAEYEDRDKTEKEKLADRAAKAEQRATEATARAVKAEVRALSAGQFADPSDAAEVLMRDPSKYVDASGEIDEDAIRADLEDLLDRKPHWRKPEPAVEPESRRAPAPKPKPKPDPGQGGRGDKPIDFRTASPEQVDAELARYGARVRR